jgi:hypothetical protein
MAFVLVLGACTTDIPQNPGPGNAIVVQFDLGAVPPVAPIPNDLTPRNPSGQLAIPSSPGDTPAQVEFNAKYLGSLTAFPHESPAQVLLSGPLDPTTVNSQSVVVIDLTTSTPVAGLAPTFDPSDNAINIAPPAGAWTRGHRYAVALVAGGGGLKGADGSPVIGSPTWALVSSPNPLVNCPANTTTAQPDLTSPRCSLAVDVVPSAEPDPAKRLEAQLSAAVQLEQIRELYAPLLAKAESLLQVDLTRIPILWTFSIVDAGEVTFDPSKRIIPFPNDILRSNGKVALPNPATGQPLTAQDCAPTTDAMTLLLCGLNTLDGFSTIAPPISENGLKSDAVAQASIDKTTLTTQTVGLIALTSTAPAGERNPMSPSFTPCLNCLSSSDAHDMPQTSPQELQWRLDVPLDEKTTYLAYVTSDVKDDKGRNVIANPVFALLRLTNPLVKGGKSQVNSLTDAQASQLEPLRAALQPALDVLENAGVARSNVALAWVFTTQSEASLLDGLYGFVSAPPSPAGQTPNVQNALPQGPIFLVDATAIYTAAAGAINLSAIGKFYTGVFVTPFALTGPGGTLDPANPRPQGVSFALTIPKVAAPAAGYPITIFAHGITRDRNDFLAIANTLAAQGQAVIAADEPFHGERSSCTGARLASNPPLPSDDAVCFPPLVAKCNEDRLVGRCVAALDSTRIPCPGLGRMPDPTGNLGCAFMRLGACAADMKCEGGDFLRDSDVSANSSSQRPVISGWNMFSLTNFFATRDNFRQEVIDLAQLVHTLRVTGPLSIQSRMPPGVATPLFDLTKINYVGVSLGGILGTLFNAVSPDTTNVVLNVSGGDLPTIILNSPSFASVKKAFLDALMPVSQGTPAFDQFLGIVQWILDPADPANMAWRLTHSITLPGGVLSPKADRKAFIQFIQDDQTVPNQSNFALLTAADRPFTNLPPSFGCKDPLFCYEFTDAKDSFDAKSVPLGQRHGFLLAPPRAPPQGGGPPVPTPEGLALTVAAQKQVATFLSAGSLP